MCDKYMHTIVHKLRLKPGPFDIDLSTVRVRLLPGTVHETVAKGSLPDRYYHVQSGMGLLCTQDE